jgi:hypothetical protein
MDRKVQEKLAKAKEGDAALAKWEVGSFGPLHRRHLPLMFGPHCRWPWQEKEQKRKRKRQAKAAGARMVMG